MSRILVICISFILIINFNFAYSYDDEDEMKRTAWSIGAGYAIYVSDMITISPSIAYGGYKDVEEDGTSTYNGNTGQYNQIDEETTFNIGRIEGGTVRNAVPSNLYIEGEFRDLDDEK